MKLFYPIGLTLSLLTLTYTSAYADSVDIVAAEFRSNRDNTWSVNVTLEHADTGWDHYADNWRVVDMEGNVLGDRVLHHPHVNEQPFTRGLRKVTIPKTLSIVYIEAHDNVDGWSENRLKIDLMKAKNGRLRVEAE